MEWGEGEHQETMLKYKVGRTKRLILLDRCGTNKKRREKVFEYGQFGNKEKSSTNSFLRTSISLAKRKDEKAHLLISAHPYSQVLKR